MIHTHTSVHLREDSQISRTLTENGTPWISLGSQVTIFIRDTEQAYAFAHELTALAEDMTRAAEREAFGLARTPEDIETARAMAEGG